MKSVPEAEIFLPSLRARVDAGRVLGRRRNEMDDDDPSKLIPLPKAFVQLFDECMLTVAQDLHHWQAFSQGHGRKMRKHFRNWRSWSLSREKHKSTFR